MQQHNCNRFLALSVCFLRFAIITLLFSLLLLCAYRFLVSDHDANNASEEWSLQTFKSVQFPFLSLFLKTVLCKSVNDLSGCIQVTGKTISYRLFALLSIMNWSSNTSSVSMLGVKWKSNILPLCSYLLWSGNYEKHKFFLPKKNFSVKPSLPTVLSIIHIIKCSVLNLSCFLLSRCSYFQKKDSEMCARCLTWNNNKKVPVLQNTRLYV